MFLEVSDPRAAHMALCSDAQLSMQYVAGESHKGLYSFHPILPARSPSLVVPSSYCSSYMETKKPRCIQDEQVWYGEARIQSILFISIDKDDEVLLVRCSMNMEMLPR